VAAARVGTLRRVSVELRKRFHFMQSLRTSALQALLAQDPGHKATLCAALDTRAHIDAVQNIPIPAEAPGRPARPVLLPATALQLPSLRTAEGKAALIHSIVHIELNAIDLALDAVVRFADMPDAFYLDWVRIAQEEALHFGLLQAHLHTYGFNYGDFPAHNGLWDMAERTRDDILARIALVPRTLEARGLDASPQVRKKLIGAGDVAAGPILDRILQDEIGHVAAGNYWYRWLCVQRNLDPITTYAALVGRYHPPKLRAPFNLDARRQAGFEEIELQALIA
jgi:uncharacterized ferritin-like protein (DUF455 family)